MRLTERKINGRYDLTETAKLDLRICLYTQVEQKLGQYEDIEEKYNILSLIDLDERLAALDIIKKKRVNVGSFIKCCANISYEEYIKRWGNWKKDILYNLSKESLTEEEFDLLKKVLSNGCSTN